MFGIMAFLNEHDHDHTTSCVIIDTWHIIFMLIKLFFWRSNLYTVKSSKTLEKLTDTPWKRHVVMRPLTIQSNATKLRTPSMTYNEGGDPRGEPKYHEDPGSDKECPRPACLALSKHALVVTGKKWRDVNNGGWAMRDTIPWENWFVYKHSLA